MSGETLGGAPASPSAADARLGFFGKLPARADFVTRRLPHGFTEPWDEWLRQAIAQSSEQLGGEWLSYYLTAPIWRFALGPGVCGDIPMIGMMMPSVDRVGRYFPLTLAIPVAGCLTPARTLLQAEGWFAKVEELALSALQDDTELESFDRDVEMIGPPVFEAEPAIRREPGGATVVTTAAQGAVALDLLDHMLKAQLHRYTLWWRAGSEDIEQSAVIAPGLPSARSFAALLDNQWERWGWRTQ